MDVLPKMKAFLATAETGSFSDAARRAGVSPSVIMKRVNELELDFRTTLFTRSTRKVSLTDMGRLYLTPIQRLVKEFEEIRSGGFRKTGGLEANLRIRTPIGPTLKFLGKLLCDFQRQNPKVSLTVITTEWPGNPIADGFDLVVGMDAMSYEGVVEEKLAPVPRVVCASPLYLESRGMPQHPQDLVSHDLLTFTPAGLNCWTFETATGPMQIDVHPILGTNNPQYLCDAGIAGVGIVQLTLLTATPGLESGRLVPILKDFPLVQRWVKLMIPEASLRQPAVQALRDVIRERYRTTTPMERGPAGLVQAEGSTFDLPHSRVA
ncbi:MAG TPA: LysR family transcriptional regulator [Stellaceae bacterium]|jgi:DNA-binding transcriptional LysR family regulator|nr:LysR family transcriptional regulator [Stellaceae bacterium]